MSPRLHAPFPGFRNSGSLGLTANQRPFLIRRTKDRSCPILSPSSPSPSSLAHSLIFLIGFDICQDESSPACITETGGEISLPGDSTWLRIAGSSRSNSGNSGRREHINVSSLFAGRGAADVPPDWKPPTGPVGITKGALTGFDVALHVPKGAESGFPVHFTMRNRSAQSQMIDWSQCVLNERVTNSAGHELPASLPCQPATGPIETDGKLAPGAAASMDFTLGDDEFALALCRAGTWHDSLQLVTSVGTVEFKDLAFDVDSPACSDSKPTSGSDALPQEKIRWTFTAQRGVRLGMAPRGQGNSEPDTRIFSVGVKIPAFKVGQPIELHLFVDNLSDTPVTMRLGPDDIRLYIRGAGLGVPATEVTPKSVLDESVPMGMLTVPPHTQQFMGTRLLTNRYDLPPGQYDVMVGLRTLQGVAEAANAPAEGPLYAAVNAATANALIEIVP